jgi:hypothetical protein
MPSGVPVATVDINGARNAAILAAKYPSRRWFGCYAGDYAGRRDLMIERYSTPEMAAVWTDEAVCRLASVEVAVCEACARLGRIPGTLSGDQDQGRL